jgi:arginine-tRNA-protein transferase
MKLYTKVRLSSPDKCPYLENRFMRLAFFYASEVSGSELDRLISNGWRKFGIYFFKPQCEGCRSCIPVRVPVETFSMSKSQRRLWRKNSDIRMSLEEDASFTELYRIYQEHSLNRFGNSVNEEEFRNHFFIKACPSAYSLYYLGGMLIAVGFLDLSSNALSSVYFVYRTQFLERGLGNYSVLREIQMASDLGLRYYYLGYYVPGSSRMQYKARFFPYQYYHWETQTWISVSSREDCTKIL